MNLDRFIFNVEGAYIDQTKKAAENLPEGVLEGQTIVFKRIGPEGREKRETFVLETPGSLFHLVLPEGLSNIKIYRHNRPGQGNGEVRFDYGEYHYLIPPLKD